MHNDLVIRIGQPGDVRALVDFNVAMARETENKVLSRDIVSTGVVAALQDSNHGFYVVAEKAGAIAGSLLVTKEWSDWRNAEFWWIQSVYVGPRYRRQGVYRRLYEFVRQQAHVEGNVCGFRLYVERDNQVAQQTYRSLGMRETVYRLYEEEF
jgi:ribosomal protein S18 acetylase RimI-like enzyme